MFVKLNSDIVINTNYIVAIEPYGNGVVNSKGNKVKHLIYMIDSHQWFLTEEDYDKIMAHI